MSRFDGTSLRTFTAADGLATDLVLAVLADRQGNVWFWTDGGASRFDGVSWQSYTTADGLASNSVLSLIQDRSGSV